MKKHRLHRLKAQITQIILLSTLYYLFSTLLAFGVEIEPMRIEYTLDAGKTYSGSFKLKNPSSFSVDVFVSSGEYRYIFSEGSIPPAGDKKTLPSCQDWFQFEKTKFNLNPGGSCDVKFLIKVPKDVKQEHLCAILFDERRSLQEIKPKEKTGNVQIQLTPRFSIPVYIFIKDTEKILAQIPAVSVVSEPEKGGVRINITLENTGNVHIRPLGTLVILNQNGEVVKNMPIGKSLPIFPAYKETIPVICPKLPAGKYSIIATIEVSKDNIIQRKTSFVLKKTGEVE